MSQGVPVGMEIGGPESAIRVLKKRVATTGTSIIVPHSLRERSINRLGAIVILTDLLYSVAPQLIEICVSAKSYSPLKYSLLYVTSHAHPGNCDT
jgi:hypothetical protein